MVTKMSTFFAFCPNTGQFKNAGLARLKIKLCLSNHYPSAAGLSLYNKNSQYSKSVWIVTTSFLKTIWTNSFKLQVVNDSQHSGSKSLEKVEQVLLKYKLNVPNLNINENFWH